MRKLLIAVLALVAVGGRSKRGHRCQHVQGPRGLHELRRARAASANPMPDRPQARLPGRRDAIRRSAATVIEKYSLGAEGLVTNPKAFPKCAFTDLDNQERVPAKCKKALVGRGLVKNAAGPSSDQSLLGQLALQPAAPAVQQRQGHGDPARQQRPAAAATASSRTRSAACCRSPRRSTRTFEKTKIDGVAASDLRFTVPQNLKHPLAGVDNSIRESSHTMLAEVEEVSGERDRLLQQGRVQGQQAHHARDLHDGGNVEPAAADVHRHEAEQVLIAA